MKYLVLWEYVDDLEKIIPKSTKLMEDREKNPDMYPKLIFPNHAILNTSPNAKMKGFAVVEADKPEKIANWIFGSYESWSVKYLPIIETPKMQEAYQKMNK